MEKIIENKQGESLILENKPENTKTIYRKLWLCDEFSDSEIVTSILSETDTIPHKS
jgi:tRNA-2-methylthio-N6-dimethylallyladenosine synthase